MLASRRQEAGALGVPPDLIEDVLRRVMRESYTSENDKGFKTLCPELRPVVIIGGQGQMGRLFSRMLNLSGYQVRTLEQEDWSQAESILADAGMVIVSVPIHITEEVINRLPKLPADCILLDLASVKNKPLQAMLAAHEGPVLGLHPMFGPDVGSLAKQVVVYCDGRDPQAYQWLLEQLQVWGARLHRISAVEHDQNMAFIQALRHFATLRTDYIWRKKTCNWNNYWHCLHRFIAWSWRWLGGYLHKIHSFTLISLCRRKIIWR